MKYVGMCLLTLALACNNGEDKDGADTSGATTNTLDSSHPIFDPHIHGTDTVDLYSNEIFKNVRVQKAGETTYLVTGQARVFEAVYHYLVREGNEVITDGHGTTDAGAPEFGHFSFTVDAKKTATDEGIYLVLFDVSANDGSRQHELPIVLLDIKKE